MQQTLFSFILMTIILFGSPGPAPISLLASGASFGYKRNVPFLCGILTGLVFAILIINLGLGKVISDSGEIPPLLSTFCGLYLSYMAYKLWRSPQKKQPIAHAPSFTNGVFLNVFNPKAYTSLITIFAPIAVSSNMSTHNALMFTELLILLCVCIVAIIDGLWLWVGTKLGEVIENRRNIQRLNTVCSLAILGVASALISL